MTGDARVLPFAAIRAWADTTCLPSCHVSLLCAEEGAARPTTFGGAVGDTDGPSHAKPFSGLPVGGSGAVLGDLPPITLGLPTGVANEFGR